MSWLFPGFLLGGAAIALPIVLHLLRRRPKRTVVFPSLRFLALTQPRTERHQNLRRWLVLLARCAALALLASAFARPYFGAEQTTGRKATVVVIDNSFSLQAGARWPSLRRWAREQIGTPGPQDTVGLLLMAPRPTWLAPIQTDAAAACAILESLGAGWELSRTEPALRLAANVLAATPADCRELIVLGDHQRLSWAGANFSQQLPSGVEAHFPKVPEPLARQAALRAPVISRTTEGLRATLVIQNFTAPQTRTLQVYRDAGKAPVHQQQVMLAERDTQTLQIELPAVAGSEMTRFRFALDNDDLPADDQAYAIWQSASERVVLLDAAPTGSAADFVGTALASTSELTPAFRVMPTTSTAWPVQAVAVLRHEASFAGEAASQLTAFLHGGGSALLFVSGGPAQTAWLANSTGITLRALQADAAPLTLRDWAMDHALVSAMAAHSVNALLGWEFRRGWSLPADAVEPLALWSGSGTAMGETSAPGGRLLLCGFTPDRREGEWPVREMFVPFLHRAVAYLLGVRESAAVRPTLVGESLTLPADSGQWRALEGPAANTAPLAVRGTVTPAAPGVYEFSHGAMRRLFAVNLAPEESEPAAWSDGAPWLGLASLPTSKPTPLRTGTTLAAIAGEARSPAWWWLIVAMAGLSLAELGLANRTTR